MSLHVLILSENTTGARRRVVADVSFIGPYPAGGEPMPPRRVNLWQIDIVEITPQYGFWFGYNRQTSALQVYAIDIFQTAQDIGVFFTNPGDPVNAPMKIPSGTFTTGVQDHEILAGLDLSSLQHVLIVAEGF